MSLHVLHDELLNVSLPKRMLLILPLDTSCSTTFFYHGCLVTHNTQIIIHAIAAHNKQYKTYDHCCMSENPRDIGWRFFCRYALLDLIGLLESPPSNLLKATRKPDVLVLLEIRG